MKILFDINHPAHAHLFRNFILYLNGAGHFVFVVSRDKDVTGTILDHSGIEHVSISSPKKSVFGMFGELVKKDYEIYKLNKKYNFDLAFGTSPSIAHLSMVSRVKSFNFNEDDDDIVPIYKWTTYPFTTKIFNPSCIRYSGFKNKRVLHNSYQKLAYLHPEVFTPNIEVVKKYNLVARNYVIVRLSALEAHHDANAKGISKDMLTELTGILNGYEIIFSREKDKKHTIDPWDMHHVLAYSKMIITDSLSMAVEGSILGVPTVRYNSFENKHSVMRETSDKYKLAFGFNSSEPGSCDLMLSKVKELLKIKDLDQIWQERRAVLLKDKVSLTHWLINYFENNIIKRGE